MELDLWFPDVDAQAGPVSEEAPTFTGTPEPASREVGSVVLICHTHDSTAISPKSQGNYTF
jgi:hypothetical protein